MTWTRTLTSLLIGFILGLICVLLTGCATRDTLKLYDKDPDRVFFYGQIQFDEARKAFALSQQTLERNDKDWPLLVEQEVPDGTVICFEHHTNTHQEDCTTAGSIRKWLQRSK